MSDHVGPRSSLLSIPSVIAMLTGAALLLAYFKGYRLESLLARGLQFSLAAGLLLYGVMQIRKHAHPVRPSSRWTTLVPYRVSLTREGAIFLVILVTVLIGGLITNSNLLMLVFGLLAGPFVINGYVTLTMLRGNKLVRQLQPRVMVGEKFGVELTMTNTRWWLSTWMMLVCDEVRNRQETLLPRVLFSRVPPKDARLGYYELTLIHRGRYEFGPLRMSTRFPLGLVERSFTVKAPGSLLVHPRIGRLTPAWYRDRQSADELTQTARSQPGTFDDEFHRLREYRAGDNPKAIHWKTSARRNSLMVREFQQSRDQDLAILLDIWLPTRPKPADYEEVERAIRFAATICVEHCRNNRDSQLSVAICGAENRSWAGGTSPHAITSVLDEFAEAEGGHHARMAEASRDQFRASGLQTRRVLITTRDIKNDEPALSEVTQEMLRSGLSMRAVSTRGEQFDKFFEGDL